MIFADFLTSLMQHWQAEPRATMIIRKLMKRQIFSEDINLFVKLKFSKIFLLTNDNVVRLFCFNFDKKIVTAKSNA